MAAAFGCICSLQAQDLRTESLIPQPQQVEVTSTQRVKPAKKDARIDKSLRVPSPEGYTLKITPNKIIIRGKSKQALVWAEQTLNQLRDANGTYPQVNIKDYPAFPIRGFMHDTGRNFVEIDMIKRHIDLISQYKVNVFHWHLTDNPAWRIECKVYPQLNDAQYQRKGRDEGRFYTYDEIRDVINYAKERGVMIIPEIDMPGHSKFFNTTFGFSMDSAEGRKVLEKCLDEFFTEIPQSLCPYFHIGSDEVHIADPKGFMEWAENLMKQYNRKAIAWDPGLPSSSTTIRQIWNEAEGNNTAAADKEGEYLDSFMGYLNYYDPLIFTNKVYLHTPCAVEQANAHAKGGILCLWNDVNVNDKEKLELHNGMTNGTLAFAERFWKGGNIGHNGDECLAPDPQSAAGKSLAAFEQKLSFHRDSILTNIPMKWVASAPMQWHITLPEARGTQKEQMKYVTAWGGAIEMDVLCKVNEVKLKPTMDAWAHTFIEVPNDTVIKAWVGFEAAARSNRISNGIGYQGYWENDGRLMVNGNDIYPADKWKEPGKYRYHYHTWHRPEEEQPYSDEQFYWMRTPVDVPLKAGINKVELYIPRVFSGQRWSFAFIPVTQDGDKITEAKGINYVSQPAE